MPDLHGKERATIDRIVRECVKAGMPTPFLGTLRGSLADAWRAALAAREEQAKTHEYEMPEAAWMVLRIRSVLERDGFPSNEAERLAHLIAAALPRGDTERPGNNEEARDEVG